MEKKASYNKIKNVSNLKKININKNQEFKKNKITNKLRNLKDQDIIIIKPPLYKTYLDLKNKIMIKNGISNSIKRKGSLNFIIKKNSESNLLDKIKLEEKTKENFLKKNAIINEYINYI